MSNLWRGLSVSKRFLLIQAVVIAALAAGNMACIGLNPEQQAAVENLRTESANLEYFSKLIDTKINSIRKDLEDGKVTLDEVKAEWNSLMAEKANIADRGAKVAAAIQKASDTGVPWWGYLLATIPTLLGIGAKVTGNGTLATVSEAAGVLSRVVARSVPAPGTGATKVGELIENELLDSSLTKKVMASIKVKAGNGDL